MSANSETSAEAAKPGTAGAGRSFAVPLAPRLLSLVGVIILAIASVIMMVFAVLAFAMQWALGLFMAAIAAFMAALTAYTLRDLRGKWSLRVVLGSDAVTLDLPSGRSLIHRPPAQHLTVRYADIEAIETRLEAYGSLGMEIMQRSYVLHDKNGGLIFLFEERALATPMESSMFADIVDDLVARANVKLRDLGMVEGRGGFLAAWGTHAPDWAAPSLSPARQIQLWRRAAATGAGAILAATATTNAWYGGLLHRPKPRRSPSQTPRRSQ